MLRAGEMIETHEFGQIDIALAQRISNVERHAALPEFGTADGVDNFRT